MEQTRGMGTQRTRVLFVCRENACRSQIAEAFARLHGGEAMEAASAGSMPRGSVDARGIAVMAERGVSLESHRSKGLPEAGPGPWDAVVGMGCGDACAHMPAAYHTEWSIPDPAGMDLDAYRAVRDQIESQVKALLQQLRRSR